MEIIKTEPGAQHPTPQSSNPWSHKKLEDFLYFNCPECEYRTQTGDDFLIHCHDHPMAKDFIGSVEDSSSSQNQDFLDPNIASTSYNQPGVDPLTFVDCNYEENQEYTSAAFIKQEHSVKTIENYSESSVNCVNFAPTFAHDPTNNWSRDVLATWQEFKSFIGRDYDYTSQDFVNFLTHNYNAKEQSINTVYLNLRGRLAVGYKNETGRNFNLDFQDCVAYCKSLIAKPDHSKAYKRKMRKDWDNFLKFTGKGLHFTDQDVKHYLKKKKEDHKYSYNSLKLQFASICRGYKEDTNGMCLKSKYPALNMYCKELYDSDIQAV